MLFAGYGYLNMNNIFLMTMTDKTIYFSVMYSVQDKMCRLWCNSLKSVYRLYKVLRAELRSWDWHHKPTGIIYLYQTIMRPYNKDILNMYMYK